MYKLFHLFPVYLLLGLVFFAQSVVADIALQSGISGEWYNPDRDGEGFFIEIVKVEGKSTFVVSWFTYNSASQMWLTGSNAFNRNDKSITIPVISTGGAAFGRDFRARDVTRTDWGTLEFQFSSCTKGVVNYNSIIGFGSGSVDITRLTTIDGLDCSNDAGKPASSGQVIDGVEITSASLFEKDLSVVATNACHVRAELKNTTLTSKSVTLTWDAFSDNRTVGTTEVTVSVPAQTTIIEEKPFVGSDTAGFLRCSDITDFFLNESRSQAL